MNLSAFQPTFKIETVTVSTDVARIQARPKGILAWIAAQMGIGAKVHLEIQPTGLSSRRTTIAGEERAFVPWSHVSASIFRLAKPIQLLFMGIILVFSGLVHLSVSRDETPGMIICVFGVVLAIAYFMTARAVTVGVLADSGTAESVKVEADVGDIEQLKAFNALADAYAASARAVSEVGPVGSPLASPGAAAGDLVP